jgi:hypothetical protein
MAKYALKAKSSNGAYEFQASGDNDKDLFKSVARFRSLYDCDKCEACQSQNIVPVYAVRGGNEFFEMTCRDCESRLQLTSSQADPNTLFPRRRVYKRDGVMLDPPEDIPNNGWTKYQRPQQQQQRKAAPVQPMAKPYVPASTAADVDESEIPF